MFWWLFIPAPALPVKNCVMLISVWFVLRRVISVLSVPRFVMLCRPSPPPPTLRSPWVLESTRSWIDMESIGDWSQRHLWSTEWVDVRFNGLVWFWLNLAVIIWLWFLIFLCWWLQRRGIWTCATCPTTARLTMTARRTTSRGVPWFTYSCRSSFRASGRPSSPRWASPTWTTTSNGSRRPCSSVSWPALDGGRVDQVSIFPS